MNFTLRDLEALRGVARFGSFTRAARALNMSQPALTVRIHHLEDALGVRLIDRTTRSVALTQVGRGFLPVVERVLTEIESVALSAGELAGRRRGLITIAAVPSVAATLLPATIVAFKARHPGITVRICDGVGQRVTNLVKSGEADFGIGSPTRRDPELRVSHLMEDPLGVAFRPGHPLEQRRHIRLREVAAYPLILMDGEYSVRVLIERAFESVGCSVLPAYEASYVATALGLARAGLGVAVIAFSAADAAATHAAGLRARVIEHPSVLRHISLIESVARSLSPAARDLVASIRETWGQRRSSARPPARNLRPSVTSATLG
jgi:LysR family transcriptional regulator, carnitine catabolism transcriptional activator